MFRMIGRGMGSMVRGVAWAGGLVLRAAHAVANDRGFQHHGRLGQFEMAEALRAFPTSNAMKTELGLMYGQGRSSLSDMGRSQVSAPSQDQTQQRGVSR